MLARLAVNAVDMDIHIYGKPDVSVDIRSQNIRKRTGACVGFKF